MEGTENDAPLPTRSILILYGSETGNSQDMAEELGKSAQRLHFKPVVEDMNSIQLVGLTLASHAFDLFSDQALAFPPAS